MTTSDGHLAFKPTDEWLVAVIVLLQRVEDHFEHTDAPLGIDCHGLLEQVRRAQ